MKNAISRYLPYLLVSLLILSALPISTAIQQEDIDPLSDLSVTVHINEIHALDTIDLVGEADFYVKVFINGQEFTSNIWKNMDHVEHPCWSATLNIPDSQEIVPIQIQLWDWNAGIDTLCDIGGIEFEFNLFNESEVELMYNTKLGKWCGDDYILYEPGMQDPSGYGRLNGCDDNSIHQNQYDCELLFDITQPDPDGDGIPYWTEVYTYNTDPAFNNIGEDADGDGVPLEWEHRWGLSYWQDNYHKNLHHFWHYWPYEWENHVELDFDQDGLNNIEEYLTSQWGSDPFRQDIFLELDEMTPGPNQEGVFIPQLTKTMLRDAYAKHNIMFFIDDYIEEEMTGGELIPFDDNVTWDETQAIYWNYFMHQDDHNWRRGVFHYGLVTYHHAGYHGFCWASEITVDETTSVFRDCIHIATKEHEEIPYKFPLMRIIGRRSIDRDYHQALIYASAIMHETGHVLGIYHENTPGCDESKGKFPWTALWWKWLPYKSCMNYGWMYTIMDYSDGSRGRNDFDDWGRIDLTAFQQELYW